MELTIGANWAGGQTDRMLISGYSTFIGDGLVTWRSKKQILLRRRICEELIQNFRSWTS